MKTKTKTYLHYQIRNDIRKKRTRKLEPLTYKGLWTKNTKTNINKKA